MLTIEINSAQVSTHKMQKTIPTLLETRQLPYFHDLTLDKIITPVTADDFAAALLHIKAARIVGFDTESKPVFDKGAANNGPHIVQFSCPDKAFIFQLNNPESHNPLLYLLSSEEILKVGFDLGSDRKLILKKFGILPRGFIDLCHTFRKMGYRNTVGIRAAIALVFNQQFHKVKQLTMSDWSAQHLSSKQQLYAANDAFAALQIYLKLEGGVKENEATLVAEHSS